MHQIENAELKDENYVEKDPNQIEIGFDEKKEKSNEENNETEILIEFPLKSRRKQ